MGDTKIKLGHLSYISINKEADILDQLKCCKIYFQHIADPSVIGNTSQFYNNLRVLIGILHKLPTELDSHTREIIQDINVLLMNTIASCSIPLDGQMMCSAAFCVGLQAVLEAHERESLYSLCLNMNGYTCIFHDLGWLPIQISEKNTELFKVCLCHGILQSNEISNILLKGSVVESPLIYVMLNILEEACMKYTRLTSIAFKVLVSWIEKVCLELKLNMTSDLLRRIFSVINSNWENPISGVKAQNTRIFKLYLDMCSTSKVCWYDCDAALKSLTSLLHHVMEVQPWKMKSKYCMLNVLLPRYGVMKAFADFPDLAPGLVSSLSYSHLASAGSDVYKTCLENMDENNWITVFMTPVVGILNGTDVISIEKQNTFSYWIPSTLKKFPVLLISLFNQLIDTAQSSGSENSIFSLISLLKLGQKLGLLFNAWNEKFAIESFKFFNFLNLMNRAIQHSSEKVRAEAFAVVCISSKTCIMPSLKEFEFVQMFLLENVNVDSSSLRQAILNSFTSFLTRIHNSCLHGLKVKHGTQIPKQSDTNSKTLYSDSDGNEVDLGWITQNIQFFNWLHNFLISNLEPGTNYQRKILSLQLYMLVLSYFNESPEWTKTSPRIRKKQVAVEGEKVLTYVPKLEQWPFKSESSYKTLLSCVLDSTDDVREAAGSILIKYFSFKESDIEENKYLLDYALQLCNSSIFYEVESGALLMKVFGNWTYKMPRDVSIELISSMKFNHTSHHLSDKKLCTGMHRSSIMFNGGKIKPPSCSVTRRSETPRDLLENHTSLEVEMESFFGQSSASSQLYHHSSSVPDSSKSREDYFFLEDLGEVCITCTSEVPDTHTNDHEQCVFESQVEPNRWDKQGGDEQETVYESDQKLFPSDDFALNEPPRRKYVHKSENVVGESSCHFPSKNYSHKLGYKNISQTYYNGSAPLSIVVLAQAEVQLTSLKRDLVQAACSGSPLHGALTALIRLAVQSDGPECGRMSVEEVERTISLLEQTVSFLLDLLAEKSASATDVAPSFAEMDEAIHCSIQQSFSHLVSAGEEGLHLSPVHQLVLNCIWLNLKACCTLASGLACTTDCSVSVVKRCGRLIAQVLMRCRHKGAIESAGVALSAFVKTITSQIKECNCTSHNDLHLMLDQLLTKFLHSIVHGGSKASVTRRSAGLSIFIHRIVASDMQIGKPLLHMCMSQLLEIARAPLGHGVSSEPKSVLVDLPQAQALHFLKILVQDSSLRQDIAQYMSSVTIICFSNFSSPVWTVRNAALQLSGALIPKLVGQKKIRDEELTLGSSVSVEEFLSHFPELTDFMLTSMQKAANCHPSQALQQHADLIPMLSLLTKVSVGSEIFINVPLAETIAQYRASFLQLISSPIYHVRKLAAKAYERFMPFSIIYDSVATVVDKLGMHNTTCDGICSNCLGFRENYLNGILLTLKYLLEKLKHDSENMSELKSKMPEIITVLKDSVTKCMNWDSCTYFNRVLLLELIEDNCNAVGTAYISTDETFKRILDVRMTLENENIQNSFKPGLLLWAAKVVDVVVKKCCPQHLVSTWYNSYALCSHYPDIVRSACTSLKLRLLHDKEIDSAIKASLFIALLKVCLEVTEECHALFPLFDVMLVLIKDEKVNVVITFKELKEISMWLMSGRKNKSEYSKAALPMVARLISQYFAHRHYIELSTQILEFVLEFSLCIKDRTDVMKYEEDFRLSAATAMCLLAPSLQSMLAEKSKEFSTKEMLKDTVEILFDVQLTLLQDEDHNVRKEAAKFVHAYTAKINRMTMSLTVNPYASLRNLMKPDVLLTLLTVPQAMEFLWKKMHYTHELESIKIKLYTDSHENDSIASPFDHGTNNIYSEETKMIDVLGRSLLEVIKVANTKERNGLRKLISFKFMNFKDDVGTVLSLLKRKESCGIFSATSSDETCYIVAKKLVYQSKVMDALRIKENCDAENVLVELQQFLKFSTN